MNSYFYVLLRASLSVRCIFFSLGLFVLAGCVTVPLTPERLSEQDLEQETGLLVGSFSRIPFGHDYYSQTFYYKNQSTNEEHSIQAQWAFNIFGGQVKDDFNAHGSRGVVFAYTLPKGAYHFTNFNLYQSTGYVYSYWSSKKPYSIPFEVSPGK